MRDMPLNIQKVERSMKQSSLPGRGRRELHSSKNPCPKCSGVRGREVAQRSGIQRCVQSVL